MRPKATYSAVGSRRMRFPTSSSSGSPPRTAQTPSVIGSSMSRRRDSSRSTGAVVVKTSQWPYDDFLVDRQARDLSYLGLHAVLDALTQKEKQQ